MTLLIFIGDFVNFHPL